MTVRLEFCLTLHSDYHIGAGYGRGSSIDSALQRDRDGVPVIRGTTLTGLLRDALQRLASLTPLAGKLRSPLPPESTNLPSQSNRPIQAADQLFGAPQMPKRWTISSARPVTLLTPQVTAPINGAHAAAHVRVHPATRRAEARKLFVREEADQRWEFAFTVESIRPDVDTLQEAALLTAAARMIEHVGAGRRRGRGRCSIRLEQIVGWDLPATTPVAQDALLQVFDDYWLQGKPAPFLPPNKPALKTDHQATTKAERRLLLLVRADEPILLSKRAAAGNQFETLDYIPGFVLRGTLATMAAARSQLDQQQSDAYQEFVRLFYRDGLICSNLLPTQYEKSSVYPTIAAPEDLFFSEQHPKDKKLEDGDRAPILARQAAHSDFKQSVGADSLKLEPTSSRFITVKQAAEFHRVEHCDEMHVTIDELTGRALDANLFGYVALAAGQYWLGEIVCKDESDWHNLRAMTGLPELTEESSRDDRKFSPLFSLRFGKAQRRGYGKVSAMLIEAPAQDPWRALPFDQRFTDVIKPFTLTLLSDAIVIDEWGRAQQGFDAKWLSKALGFAVQIDEAQGQPDPQSGRAMPYQLAFAQPRLVDTFNNHFGLPRSRDLALRSGSAVTLKITEQALSAQAITKRLETIETTGIGLRRNEGFGRVVINHPIYQNVCAAVDRNSQFVPDALRHLDDFRKTSIGSEEKWQQDWLQHLEERTEELASFKRSEFAGLMRELASGQIDSLAAAEQLLHKYGSPEKDDLFKENTFYRQKPNSFAVGQKFAREIAFLRQLFRSLEEQTQVEEKRQRWQIGSRILADCIGQEIAKEEGR